MIVTIGPPPLLTYENKALIQIYHVFVVFLVNRIVAVGILLRKLSMIIMRWKEGFWWMFRSWDSYGFVIPADLGGSVIQETIIRKPINLCYSHGTIEYRIMLWHFASYHGIYPPCSATPLRLVGIILIVPCISNCSASRSPRAPFAVASLSSWIKGYEALRTARGPQKSQVICKRICAQKFARPPI